MIVKIVRNDKEFAVKFSYDERIISIIQSLMTTIWCKSDKFWLIPITHYSEFIRELRHYKFKVSIKNLERRVVIVTNYKVFKVTFCNKNDPQIESFSNIGVGNLKEDNQIEYKQTATNEDLVMNRLIDLKYDLYILEELDMYDD